MNESNITKRNTSIEIKMLPLDRPKTWKSEGFKF